MGFADSWMFMTNNDFNENSAQVMYSPTARDAFGVETIYFNDENTWLHALTYNRLLQRWNMPDAQANLFLMTGVGATRGHGETDGAAFAGIEADWENRRFYTLYQNRVIGSGGLHENFSQKLRVGVAPYIGNYDDVHTWLMVQVDHFPDRRDDITVTPFVRMFTNSVLGELGVSDKGDVLFNLTYQM